MTSDFPPETKESNVSNQADTASCRIAVLILPSFNAMATMALLDPFRAANYLSAVPLYSWQVVSADDAPVTASNGVAAVGAIPLSQAAAEFDFVFVSASWTPERCRDKRMFDWLRRCARAGTALGGLDTGAFVLAYAGLLSHRRATVHYEHAAAFRELFPEIGVSDALFVIDGNRLTCCGGAAASDLALEIIRMQHGIDLANASARYIFHDRLRSSAEQQSPQHHEPVGYAAPQKLRQAIIMMERHLETPLPLSTVALACGLSQRHIERLFREHTGVTPVSYYMDVRLDRARGMITQTDMSVLQVSVACGFASPEYFSRVYRKRFGLTPSEDRIEGRVPFQFRSYPAHAGA